MDENALRLKQIAFLLANQAIRELDGATQTEKIVFLAKAGFSNQEIGNFVGTTAAAVSVRRAESKRGKREAPKKRK